MKSFHLITLVILLSSSLFFSSRLASASKTLSVELEGYESFSLGKLYGTAIGLDGGLYVAPSMKEIVKLPESQVTDLAKKKTGNQVFVATAGKPAMIYRLNDNPTNPEIYASFQQPIVSRMIVFNEKLYVATAPNGGIFEIVDKNKLQLLWKAKENIIWDFCIASDNKLYAAVGIPGRIYQIDPANNYKEMIFFESDETHITKLSCDAKRFLIAGGGGKGIIYELQKNGKAYALIDSQLEETSQIITDNFGNIYVSTISRDPNSVSQLPKKGQVVNVTVENFSIDTTVQIQTTEVYHIDPSNAVELIFRATNEGVTGLSLSSKDTLLVSTAGSEKEPGHIYLVNLGGNYNIEVLGQTESTQITSMLADSSWYYLGTSHIGRVYRMDRSRQEKGYYISNVFNATLYSVFGNIIIDSVGYNNDIKVWTRTGNTEKVDNTWNEWKEASHTESGFKNQSSSAQYFQFKLELPQKNKEDASIKKVTFYYQTKNISPFVYNVDFLPRGTYLKIDSNTLEGEKSGNLDVNKLKQLANEDKEEQQANTIARGKYGNQKGFDTIIWETSDPNRDQVSSDLYIKSLPNGNWKLLQKDMAQSFYTFESKNMADGYYQFKIEVSDHLSNLVETALSSSQTSPRFLIDNNAPTISKVSVSSQSNNVIRLQFIAEDSVSTIQKASAFIDDHLTLLYIEPNDRLFDERQEQFDLLIPGIDSGSHQVIILVSDSFNNQSRVSTFVTVK